MNTTEKGPNALIIIKRDTWTCRLEIISLHFVRNWDQIELFSLFSWVIETIFDGQFWRARLKTRWNMENVCWACAPNYLENINVTLQKFRFAWAVEMGFWKCFQLQIILLVVFIVNFFVFLVFKRFLSLILEFLHHFCFFTEKLLYQFHAKSKHFVEKISSLFFFLLKNLNILRHFETISYSLLYFTHQNGNPFWKTILNSFLNF